MSDDLFTVIGFLMKSEERSVHNRHTPLPSKDGQVPKPQRPDASPALTSPPSPTPVKPV